MEIVFEKLFLVQVVVLFYHAPHVASIDISQECSDLCDFYQWGKDANCQGRNFEDVPEVCNNAKTLQLQDNRVSLLKREAFRNFTCLKYLYLERNNLSLDVGAFRGCDSLRKVHLSQNYLPTLNAGILEGLSEVLYMFIDNARVQEVEPGAFNDMRQLSFLSLEDNEMTVPPCDAFSAEGSVLVTLRLANNSISILPDGCFARFPRLVSLSLQHNPLGEPNPSAFQGLVSLTDLDLRFTDLEVVPTGIFHFASKIKRLSLAHNHIQTLADRDFAPLSDLTTLHLQHNRIMTVGQFSFQFLVSVQVLDLSHNLIQSIDQTALDDCLPLNDLRLQNNLLQSTKNISFSDVSIIATVNITNNPLHCDCSLYPYQQWLKLSGSNQNDPLHEYTLPTCATPPSLAGQWVVDVKFTDCPVYGKHIAIETIDNVQTTVQPISQRPDLSSSWIPIAAALACFSSVIVLVITVGILLYRRKRKLYKRCKPAYLPVSNTGEERMRCNRDSEKTLTLTDNPLAFPPNSPARAPEQGCHQFDYVGPVYKPVTYSTCIHGPGDNRAENCPNHQPRMPPERNSHNPVPVGARKDEVIYSSMAGTANSPESDEDPCKELSVEEWLKRNCKATITRHDHVTNDDDQTADDSLHTSPTKTTSPVAPIRPGPTLAAEASLRDTNNNDKYCDKRSLPANQQQGYVPWQHGSAMPP